MKIRFSMLAPAALLFAACHRDDLTAAEAKQAVEESTVASQAGALTGSSVEVSTNFTIGGGVEAAAEELRAYFASQLPCAKLTVERGSLAIEYGAEPGRACTYEGQTYAGRHTITVERNDGEALVHHAWEGLSNGRVSVTGTADVTWSGADRSRHSVYDVTWTRLSDGRTGRGTGDVTMRALGGAGREGVTIDGERRWEGERGAWALDIEGVEARWADPVPQAGSYVLTGPEGKRLTLSFERVDGDTIRVNVDGTRRDFHFDVTATGEVGDAGDAAPGDGGEGG
jgi:hypothetical protein